MVCRPRPKRQARDHELFSVFTVCPEIIVTGRERIQYGWNPWQGSGEPGHGPLLPGIVNSLLLLAQTTAYLLP